MPNYKVNNETYTIPDNEVELFESDFPDAQLHYQTSDGEKYTIYAKERKDFLADFPDATELGWKSEVPEQEAAGQMPKFDPEKAGTPPVPMFDDKPNAIPLPQQEKEYNTTLAEGFKQEARNLGAGVQALAGESLNLFSGTSLDDQSALRLLKEAEKAGMSVADYTKARRMDMLRSMGKTPMDEGGRWSKEEAELLEQDAKILKVYEDALKAANGNVNQAKKILEEQAQDLTRGDAMIGKAAETLSQAKENKGWAWLGGLLPQMAGNASAIALGYLTKGRSAGLSSALMGTSRALGLGSMAGLTASTAGMSMVEAREKGASTKDVWAVGMANAAIEWLTEKIPFDTYTKKIYGAVKSKLSKGVSEVLSSQAGREELERLLVKANQELGGKLFSGKNLSDYIKSIAEEAGSEAIAEALQTITPMIYLNPEEYPELSDVIGAAWEGAKGGLVMGAMLGGASKATEHALNKDRRKSQGYVDVAVMQTEGNDPEVVEVLSVDDENGIATVLQGGEAVEVKKDAIEGDRYRFTYADFENARLTELEDEAIDNETVTEGQAKAAGDRVAITATELDKALAGLSEEQKQAILNDAERDVDTIVPEDANEAYQAHRDALRREREVKETLSLQQEKAKLAIRDELTEKVGGQFWREQTDAAGDNSLSLVETGMLTDGTQVYIVSEVNEAGEALGVTEDGRKMVVKNDMLQDGTQIMTLTEFIDQRYAENKGVAEQTRMLAETDRRNAEVMSEAIMGSRINLGTEEAPRYGTVNTAPNADGVIVLLDDGGAVSVSMDELANILGKGAILTDAELASAESAEILGAEAALKTERAQNPQQVSSATDEAVVSQKTAEEAMRFPLKADGSVDQTTLWNQDPERWAQWNDEQRQDGGANSLAYINGAISREQAKLAEMVSAYNAEPDFDARNAMESELVVTQERLNRLTALQQNYAPQVAQQDQPVQTESSVESKSDETHETNVRQTVIDLYNDAELTEEEIEEYIKANIRKSQAELDKHLSKAPKMGIDISQYKEKRAKHAEKTAELEKQLRFWKDVHSYVEVPTTQFDMEPQNALEFAARELSIKDGIKLQPDSFKRHTGYGAEIGNFLSILRTKEKGGLTLEAAGERLMELDRENNTGFFDQGDPNAGLNAILDVLGGTRTSGDISGYIKANREQTAKEEVAAARNAMMEEVAAGAEGQQTPTNNAQFEYYEGDMSSLVEESKATSQGLIKKIISPASERLISDLNNEGVSIDSSYNHTIDNSGVRHILKQHGTSKEYKRGQIPITEDDFLLIEDIINNYDEILTEQNKRGQDVIVYVKSYPDGTTYYVEEVRVGRKELAADSMYKRKNRLTDANGNETTQISDLSVPEELDNRHTTDKQSVETVEASQVAEQSDTQPTSSMNASTTSSEDKDSNIVESAIESEEKVEEIGDIPDDIWESSLDEDMPDFTNSASAYFPSEQMKQKFSTMRARINDWAQKLGVQVRIMETLDDVINQSAREQILKGGKVYGYFDPATGEVTFYLPDFLSLHGRELTEKEFLSEIDKTYIHEVVAHRGLRGLLGEDKYGELCDMVWDGMTEQQKANFLNYPGVNGNSRIAADEFIAHFAEHVDYNDNRTLWDKIVDFIKDLLTFDNRIEISNEELAEILRHSYARLARNAKTATDANANQQAEGNTVFRAANGTLVGMHNISEDKLRKVIKQGGSANPSTAVIDIERQSFGSYGEISFIMPSSLVDAGTGRNAGTFTADAWTPTYPQVTKRFSDDKLQRAYWRDVSAIPEEMSHEVRMAFDSWLDDRNANGLAYMFLHERGEAPEMVRVEAKFPQEIKDKLSDILGENRSTLYKLSDEEKQAVLDLYIQENFGGSRENFDKSIAEHIQRIEDRLSTGKVPSFIEKRITLDLQWMKEHGYNYDNLSSFVDNIVSDIRHAGEVNDAATTNRALDYIKDNGLEKEFSEWKEGLNNRYGIKEYLFSGYTPSGNQRWLPNTVENASKLMNKEGLAGATGLAVSFNSFVATLAPKKKTLSDIRASKDRLVEDRKLVDDFREKWSEVFFDLGVKCQPGANIYDDYGPARLTEAAQKKNPGAYLKKEYGVELSQEDLQKLDEMIKAIKTEFPANYFETKFQRPVYLDEFAAAVMPTSTSEDIKQAVSKAGLPIFEYDSAVEGSRKEATLKATEGEGVRFRTAPSDRVLYLFNQARAGELGGKPISVGSLTKEGKEYLERISGIKLKENVSFVLNPSDLNHIYNDHYGKNEKDTGNNIPLNDYDIRRLVDVIAFPTRVVFGEDKQGRKVFYFLSETPSGTYNLMEIYANKKGNLTAKTYYKTKKGATQRVMELESLLSTSETYSGATLSDAKIPILFDIANQEDDDIRFRVTPEQDKAYMDAVEAGDLDAAQRMVIEAAKLAMPNTKVVDEYGNPKVVYHGTPNEFWSFDKDKIGSTNDSGFWGEGFYFTSQEALAFHYAQGGRVLPVFLNIRNPHDFAFFTKEYYDHLERFGMFGDKDFSSSRITEELTKEGKDGVIRRDSYDGHAEYVVFSPSQIKSADPVTYDDNGNVIPLSERFNLENADIRFRMRGENESAMDFTQSEVDAYYSKYNSLAETIVSQVNEDVAREHGYTLEELKKIYGVYESEKDRITIFAHEENYDGDKLETSLFHESIHKLAEFYPYLVKAGEWMYNNADRFKTFAELKDIIVDEYEPEWHHEEMLCYVISACMNVGVVEEVMTLMPQEHKRNVEQILNEIGYDITTEGGRRKARRSLSESAVSEDLRDAEGKSESGRSGKETKGSSRAEFSAEERRVINDYFPGTFAEPIEQARQEVDQNPTDAQKEAGNYRKGHLRLDGYNITIENPKGSVRRGTDSKGNAWENTLNNDYGYIRGTEGVDGDHIDVYLSDNPTEGNVFVIDQVNPETREFDEHKVMYGFNSAEEARDAYLANFSEGWNGLGTITEVSKDEFKKWIESSHRKTKPFSEYKSVKIIGAQSEGEEMKDDFLPSTGTPTDEVVTNGLRLTPSQTATLAGNIFSALPEESRERITDGLGSIADLQDAILQIPTSLATKESWSDEDRVVAEVVAEQMTKMAGDMTRPFSAEEGLWLLYNNLNRATDLVSEASRALVRRNLGFDDETLAQQEQAKEDVRFRSVSNANNETTAKLYNKGAVNVWTRLKESFVDMNASVDELVKAMVKRSGKEPKGFEDIRLALNQQSSKGLAAMEGYERKFLNPMLDAISDIIRKTKKSYDQIVRYVILKHGLERNDSFAKRDAREYYGEMFKKVADRMKNQSHAQRVVNLSEAKKALAAVEAKMVNAKGDKLERLKEEREAAMFEVTVAELVLRGNEKQNESDLKARMDAIDAGTDAKYQELRDKDYSGITSMFYDQLDVDRNKYDTEEEYQAALMEAKQDKYATLADVEAAAQAEVDAFEKDVNTAKLWKRINAATKETLRQQYEANMISKEQYETLRDMFQFYVPLRGFADNTAEDMYTYYRKPNSTGYTKPILGAEGRKTEAESPFGWIAAMANSAIASNVKNEAKLALFYFVSNRPDNGIATISKTWFEFSHTDPVTGKKVYKPAYPPFTEGLSSDQARADFEQWQEDMKAKRAAGQAYESGQRLNLGNAVVNISDRNRPEHIVNVKVAGKDYTIIINGNPRAAQAINGDLNIEATAGDYSKVFGPILRWMSSVNTSYNPEFWITNMQRDMLFTLMNVTASQSPAYRKKFFSNYAKAFKVISMAGKNERGTLGNSYIEKMYQEFVENGGVTGFTQIKDNEVWEKDIENYMKSANMEDKKMGRILSGTKDALHVFHRFGESMEQVSRFAAFLTSREMGMSMAESINSAKEITVNFNRKGSGKMISWEETKKLTGKNGKPLNDFERLLVWGISSMAPLGRRFIMFFNASIQGLNAMYKLYKNNPSKMTAWSLGYLSLGVMQALVHAMMDDDDDYLDIPQYERRTSLMLGGNGTYFKWALPQEARAFYALGDLAVESIMGRNPHQNVIMEALKIGADIAPVNPTEGWKAFLPSVAVPFVELMINEDWKGDPIYNEQKWLTSEERKRTAKAAGAYQGTGKMYIWISEALNNISGGDDYDAGLINIQPEKMEHLVQSAFGGTIRTADKFFNTIMAAIDPEEEWTVKQTPFLNRLLTINDERFRNVHVNEVYDYYKAEAEHAKTLQKKYTKDRDMDAYRDLMNSDEMQWSRIYERYKKPIMNLQEKIKVAEGTAERRELMKQQDELKRRMIKEISELSR